MKRLVCFLIAVLAVSLLDLEMAAADGPLVQWEKTFGGTGRDEAYCVQQTSDGGYIIVGSTDSYGAAGWADVYLIKTDPYGNSEWEKTFGGSGSEEAFSVQQTSDGGYIIVGIIVGETASDVYLIKADPCGNNEWQKTFGTNPDHEIYEGGHSVQQTSEGGYIIAGMTCYWYHLHPYPETLCDCDFYLIKTDSVGNMQWERIFGESNANEQAYSIQQTSDGGYIIAGLIDSCAANPQERCEDVYLIKTDSAGNTQWDKTFGGSGFETGQSVQQTSNGGYIVAGRSSSYGAGGYDVYLIKTDSAGNMLWQKTFGGSDYDEGYLVQQTADGGYIIAGRTSSYGAGGCDVYLIKTDSAGNMQWEKTFGGSGYDVGYSVQQTSDSGYIIAGDTSSYGAGGYDVYLIKVGPDALRAANLWDGKSIELQWPKGFGRVLLVRKDEDGSNKVEWEIEANSFIDEGVKADQTKDGQEYEPVKPGRTYKYVLKSTDLTQIRSNTVKVKAEVIVVLVRGYAPFGSGVNANYWKPEKHPEALEDVNTWFTGNGVTCWVPPQGYPGPGLAGCKSIDDNADELKTFISGKLIGNYKDAKINLVGHSMGGLISRKYAHDNPGIVTNIFAIHTPHTGSTLAEIRAFWPSNPATYNLTPFYLSFFNVWNKDLDSTKLYSFWSENYRYVFNDRFLKLGHAIMLKDRRFIGGGNDGAVPKLSALGYIWDYSENIHGTLRCEVFIHDAANTLLDHYSCYRNTYTLEMIMYWMELPLSQTLSIQMPLATADGNEPEIAPQYFVAGFEGQLDSLTPVKETVSIGDSSTAYFRAITSDANCSFTLSDPCGTTYDPCYASTEPNVTYETEDEIFLYEVNSPAPGTWILKLSTTVAPPYSVDYGLTAFEDANIALYAYTNPDWANTDANVLVLATLTENNSPVIDANLTADITLPDTNIVSLVLYDDGLHNDANADDGIYADTFDITTQVGIYSGQITATGILSGTVFERMSPLSFTISAPDINFAGDINDVGVDLNGNSLYDILQFTAPVDVNEPNEFLLTATLSDNNDNIIKMLSTSEVNLPAGPNVLTLEVTAEDIVKHDVNGPYTLSHITLSDANTGLTIAVHPDYNTTAYTVADFEPLDTDGDGLSDNFEISIGTDVNLSDSDFDGLTDYEEISYDSDANSYNPASDLNPLSSDTDTDGMSDGWEMYWGFDPLNDDGTKDDDDDSDGLTNLQEYQNNTEPNNLDTDADGMPDGWEVNFGFNPVLFDSANDYDSDGLTNLQEYQNGTDPNDPDTDDDGIQDGPDNCKLMYNPDQSDADGDGIGDTCEADISGNNEVNFLDFAMLASRWLDVGCGDCGGADLDGQEDVDFADLDILAENWLAGTTP